MKKVLSLILALVLVSSMSLTAFAAEAEESDTIHAPMEPTIYYDIPMPIAGEEAGETLLISADEIAEMSQDDFYAFLSENTPLNEDEIAQIVAYYHSDDYKNGVAPAYGIYDHPEWYIEPYVKTSTKMVVYATSWIGIDAYRSSVGMTKGKTETKTIKFSLGYTGDKEIKNFNNKLTASFESSTTTTVSESQTCPAWTTMNWRPYALYWKDEYYGKMKITTIIPYTGGVYENVWYEEFMGTDKRLITDTTEVWSRVNSAHNVNATTPTPPTGAPNV